MSATDLAERLLAAGIPVIVVGPGDIPRQKWLNIRSAAECDLSLYRPGDALAMITGHGLDGVDVDAKDGKGGSVDHLPPFKSYGKTATPSGGEHYIVPSTGIAKMQDLRTDLGFVGDYCGGCADGESRTLLFLPGSVRSKYPHGGYVEEVPWRIEECLAADPDPDLVEALENAGGGRESTRDVYRDDSPERDPELGSHPYAARAVEGELARLDELDLLGWSGPGWDNTCFAVACNLAEIGNSGWTGYSLEELHEAFLDRAPADADFGPSDHETKWASALKRTDGGGRRCPDEKAEDVFDAVPAEESEAAEPDAVKSRFAPLNLPEILDPNRPPRTWFWEQVIPAGDQASLIAPGGTGKSLLALALCMAAVSGQPDFIGRKLDFAGKVLYVDMENSEDDWAERLRDLGWDHESIRSVADRFIPLSLPPLRGLDTAEGAKQLRAVIRAYGIGKGDLLVLDSTQRVTEGEENSNDTLRSLYNHTSGWLKAAGITVLRTDNTGWDDSRERGASAKRDDVGYALLLKPVKPDTFRLVNTKHRSKGKADGLTFIRTNDADGKLVFTQPVAKDEFLSDHELTTHQQDTLLRVRMLTNPEDPRYEADAVSAERALSGVPGKTDLKRNGLEQLVKDGYLAKVPFFNADGSESKRPPGITVSANGRAWIDEQGTWADARLEEIARKAEN